MSEQMSGPEMIALDRANRLATRVIEVLKTWAERKQITLRQAEMQEVARLAEQLRQEILAARGLPGRVAIPEAMRQAVLARDDWRCQLCHADLHDRPNDIQIDHVVPVARYGATVPDNLQTTCRTCNRAKGAAA